MEQRKNERKSMGHDAVVSCPQFGLFRGQIENLSLFGMYVKATTVNMCLRVPVTITFQPEVENLSESCSVEGVVVHQDNQGFGVCFSDLKESHQLMLQDVLSKQPYANEVTNTRLLVG